MKSGEEWHNKVYQSSRLPRKAVLTPNLHHGRQDLSNLEARTSTEPSKQTKRVVMRNPLRRVGLQNTRSTPLNRPRERRCSQGDSQETDPPVRNTPEPRVIDGRLEQDPKIQCVQQRVEGIDQQHG